MSALARRLSAEAAEIERTLAGRTPTARDAALDLAELLREGAEKARRLDAAERRIPVTLIGETHHAR